MVSSKVRISINQSARTLNPRNFCAPPQPEGVGVKFSSRALRDCGDTDIITKAAGAAVSAAICG